MATKTRPAKPKPAPEPEPIEADPVDAGEVEEYYEPEVGEWVTVRDAEGVITRIGLVVDEGAEPNLRHTDEYNQPKPETRQPVIAWLTLDGVPSPYGLELSPLA